MGVPAPLLWAVALAGLAAPTPAGDDAAPAVAPAPARMDVPAIDPPPAAHAALRVVVMVADADDAALLTRLRGQSSNLDVELIEEDVALPPTLEGQVTAADALASAHGARVAVWARLHGGRGAPRAVYVSESGAGRVLVRLLFEDTAEAAADPRSSTATLESAALILRGALRALGEGAVIGIAREELLPPPAPVIPPAPTLRPSRARAIPTMRIGYQVALDGHSSLGQQGARLDLGLRRGRAEIGLAAAAGPGADLSSDDTTVRLARFSLAARAAARLSLSSELDLWAAALIGMAAFARQTEHHPDGVTPTLDHTTLSLLTGPELSVAWHGRGPDRGFAVWLAAGADFVPAAPVLGLDVAGAFQASQALWRIQPRLGLGMAWTRP